MIKAIDFTEYSGTYYVQFKGENGLEVYDKVSGNSPMEIARKFLKNPVKCSRTKGVIAIISNDYRFDNNRVRWNYYKES